LVATGTVESNAVTIRHGTVSATIAGKAGSGTVQGLATAGLLDRSFVGTRAILDVSEFVAGVVSRASPAEIGLSGIVGGIEPIAPEAPGGIAVHFGDGEGARSVRAITVPGIVESVGIDSIERLADGETATAQIDRGVVTADGEREREVTDAEVTFTIHDGGPRIVDVDATFLAAAEAGAFEEPASGPGGTQHTADR
ncbi:MAG: NAD(+)/NADH kinase, partial [Halobacteriota archaeon]